MYDYLGDNPSHASAIQWTLKLEKTPIYVIEPCGAFASDTYRLLRQFLLEQVKGVEGVSIPVERVSIPGVISRTTRDWSGLALPVVAPEIRGMDRWTTKALVSKKKRVAKGVSNFLERVYYELHNLGREPQERALNFAATMALEEVEGIYEKATNEEDEEMELDTIEVERTPVCRPDSDCWDVKLIFFFPERQVQTVRRLYRFTVDVTDVVPATVGPMRSWSIR